MADGGKHAGKSGELAKTQRTRLKRLPKRGHYDRATLHAILDAMPMCHVGYVIDGKPLVTPTLQWREGEHVYWHGSRASRALLSAAGTDVCLTVAIIDGMVMARSAFHHSANYRAAMLFGRAVPVPAEAKLERMRIFVEHFFPGRWDELRPVTRKELNATTILALEIDEASAKIRTGGPIDDAEDYALPIWAGVLPVRFQVGKAESDPRNLPGVETPAYLRKFRIG
jgi:nitroimidazol reductase NimA-like FMN-containing flavoprotein (pyridoxamine 5'-phosphate oxidase superfamily)